MLTNIQPPQTLIEAIHQNNLTVVNDFITNQGIDPSDENNHAITDACALGHLDIIKRLLQDERVDITVNQHEPLYFAAANGHTKVVEFLLNEYNINLAEDTDDAALVSAAENNHKLVVYLLSDWLDRHNLEPNDTTDTSKIDPILQERSDINFTATLTAYKLMQENNSFNATVFPKDVAKFTAESLAASEYDVDRVTKTISRLDTP